MSLRSRILRKSLLGLRRVAQLLLRLGGKLRQDVAFDVADIRHARGLAIGRERRRDARSRGR